MTASDLLHSGLLLSFLMFHLAASNTVQIQSHNIDDILNHNELVLVNFYADWCRFSQMLKPIYEDTAKKIAEEFPERGKVALATVDCDRETSIAQKFQVSKYPTLKLFRFGQQIKREYRGQRSVDAMANFIRDQLKDPVIRYDNLEALEELDTQKRHLIGYFNSDDGVDYQVFLKVGSMLRDDCQAHAIVGEAAEKERMTGNKVVFRPSGELATDMLYTGPLQDYNILLKWATDKCVPLVREITFENAEELTEEGLPFMILFHHPDDTDTPERFKKIVAQELLPETKSINFLTANGEKFSHPLFHLGKTTKDLPVLAIDSFRHMYLWKHDPKTEIDTPGYLKEFVADLHSGKLHREFHHGPDPTTKSSETPIPAIESAGPTHVPKQDDKPAEQKKEPVPTTPPESTFKKLAPSRNRYTLLRDEL